MLILTEGRSEAEYFNAFRGKNRNIAVIPIVAKRHDPENLIPYCHSRVYEYSIDLDAGDTVSVVIDVDNLTKTELTAIGRQCDDEGFELYLSNRSFECWLIMHFHEMTRPMTQDELNDELTECIGRKYCKSEGIRKVISDDDIDRAVSFAAK